MDLVGTLETGQFPEILEFGNVLQRSTSHLDNLSLLHAFSVLKIKFGLKMFLESSRRELGTPRRLK